MDVYNYKLDIFEGPLELLLHLIEKHKVDIYDIPIVEITSQYMSYLKNWNHFDIDYSSEFVVMAATLLQIKSRMLLPKQTVETGEEIIDPRDELVNRLLEFKEIKALTEVLHTKSEATSQSFARVEALSLIGKESIYTFEVKTLFSIFEDVCQRKIEHKVEIPMVKVEKESFSLANKIKEIKKRILSENISFHNLIERCRTKEEAVVSFLAVLELLKFQILKIRNSDDSSKNEDIILESAIMMEGVSDES